jgi:flavin reductase (DIM6/NTAB) family NADH-FMN oxidoreductase RutF
MTSIDNREFRNALGHFATGVVIITAELDGQLLGSTISSFNSVSLTPPLVLFSLARSAFGLELWRRVAHYGVMVLAEHQSDLSNRFAKSGPDKWQGLHTGVMKNGAPLLPDWLAYFECAPYARYDGGDHEIFVGRVEAFDYRAHGFEPKPLVFYQGRYRSLGSSTGTPPPEMDAWSIAW